MSISEYMVDDETYYKVRISRKNKNGKTISRRLAKDKKWQIDKVFKNCKKC